MDRLSLQLCVKGFRSHIFFCSVPFFSLFQNFLLSASASLGCRDVLVNLKDFSRKDDRATLTFLLGNDYLLIEHETLLSIFAFICLQNFLFKQGKSNNIESAIRTIAESYHESDFIHHGLYSLQNDLRTIQSFNSLSNAIEKNCCDLTYISLSCDKYSIASNDRDLLVFHPLSDTSNEDFYSESDADLLIKKADLDCVNYWTFKLGNKIIRAKIAQSEVSTMQDIVNRCPLAGRYLRVKLGYSYKDIDEDVSSYKFKIVKILGDPRDFPSLSNCSDFNLDHKKIVSRKQLDLF